MSDVLDDFDADILQACIDPIEESGVDPHRVDQLRALVRAHEGRGDMERTLIALNQRQNAAILQSEPLHLVEAEEERRDERSASTMSLLHQAGYFTESDLSFIDRFLHPPARGSPEAAPPGGGRSILRRSFDAFLSGWRGR